MENGIKDIDTLDSDKITDVESDIKRLIKETHQLKSNLRAKEERIKKDTKTLFLELLKVVDSFEGFFLHIEPHLLEVDKRTKKWIGNFQSIKRQFERVLKEEGVTIIEVPDKKVIPGYHHIIETKQVDGLEDDVIIEEKLKGYLKFGEVLRKSEVIAVKNLL
jgi:molecular chaperone GrpE (heat shock protein)